MSKPSIVSVGAGNVASHLIPALFKENFHISCIYSRTIENAENLAGSVSSKFSNKLTDIPSDADIYIISLSDHAVLDAIKALTGVNGLVIHTGGSLGIDVFQGKVSKYGVLYPLQTFNKFIELDLSKVPFLIEASDTYSLNMITELASVFSSNILYMTSEQRKWVHIAAIFACNFVNHMFVCSEQILSRESIDFQILIPLIEETVRKAKQGDPARFQTGPAIRGNFDITDNHTRMMKEFPDLQNLYTFVTKLIYEYHQKLK